MLVPASVASGSLDFRVKNQFGAAYPESGGSNQSALHWDMVCEMRQRNGAPAGTITADGEVFHQNGAFIQDGWPGE